MQKRCRILRYISHCIHYVMLGAWFGIFPLSAADPAQSIGKELERETRWQNPDYIRQAFSHIALNNEYDTYKHAVRKWHIPIRVFIEHQVADVALHTQLVQMHLSHLTEITGHDIRLVDSLEKANLHLVFTRQSLWANEIVRLMGPGAVQNIHGSVCMAKFALNSLQQIERAWVVIPVDQAKMHGKLVACIVEEMTQVLGLPNDSEKVFPSIFNDKTQQDLLTGLDFILLKLLYSPSIRAGMTAAEVEQPLLNLLTQWQRDGTIMNADKMVRQGKLYPLLGY